MPYRWGLVVLLWWILLLNYLDRQIIFSVFPLLQRDLHLTSMELGLISTSFLWVYALASPAAGYLADRVGYRPVILASLLIWSVVTWSTAHVQSLPQLLIVRGLMGFSEACYLPAGLALIAAWHSEKTRALATGIHYSGLYAGMVLGGALGGWLGLRYGWRFAFTALGVIGVAYALAAAPLLRDRAPSIVEAPRRSLREGAAELFRIPAYRTLFVVFAALSLANWVVYTWLPLYLFERFGMNLAEAGFSAAFYLQAGSVAGVALGGWRGDRPSATAPGTRLRVQALGLAAAAPFLFLSGSTGSSWLLLGAMVVFGIGRGVFDANAMPALCQIAPAELRSTGFGLFNLIGPLAGGAIAAAAGGLKSSIGIGGALQITGVLLAAAAGLLWRGTIAPKPILIEQQTPYRA